MGIKPRVMIAGIRRSSMGTSCSNVLRCKRLRSSAVIFHHIYGHYQKGFKKLLLSVRKTTLIHLYRCARKTPSIPVPGRTTHGSAGEDETY